MSQFDLGIISDEVSGDFERSCRLIAEWGLGHVELRMLWGENVLKLSDDRLRLARKLIDDNGLTVTAIASPVFKSPLDGKPRQMEADFSLGGAESLEEQLELLDRSADLCELFDTRFIRIFTFWREPWSDGLARDLSSKLARAAELARDRDVVLAVENEPVCIVGTGAELGKLWTHLRESVSPDLLAHLTPLWDPGNAQAAGERAFPDGYRAVAEYGPGHVHLKDIVPGKDGEPRFVPVGQGEVGFEAQLRALTDDGYGGVLVLEPHYNPAGEPQEEAAHTAVTAAQELLIRVSSGG